MDEFELIRRYFPQERGEGVVLGIGDDGAVVAPGAEKLAVAVDTLVSGVHYPAALAADDVGWRAVAVNASDLAAMGARPLWFTLALTLESADAAWLGKFSEGLYAAASKYGATLIGGDTTRGPVTVVTVQIIGAVSEHGAIRRGGASPGEQVWVTGTPGDAAGGLAVVSGREAAGAEAGDLAVLTARFARPSARVEFGMAIAGIATAAIDVSDGLAADLQKLAAASRVAAVVEEESLPLSAALCRVFGRERARELALTGGDDYELCFTAAPADAERLRALAATHNVEVAVIGRTEPGSGVALANGQGRRPWQGGGYSHF